MDHKLDDDKPMRIVKRTVTEEVFEELEPTHSRPAAPARDQALDEADCPPEERRRRRC